jgi:tetratricopeptide (TPR) repeat protein
MTRGAYTVAVMILVGGSCRDEPRAHRRAAPPATRGPAADGSVEWAGCAVVHSGPRCQLAGDRRLTVWAPDEAIRRWRFTADGAPLPPAKQTRVQEGWRLTFTVPTAARGIAAGAVAGGGEGPTWSLALVEPSDRDERGRTEIDELLKTGKQGRAREAATRLQQIAETGQEALRGPAQAALGRVELARGNLGRAAIALREAMRAAHREGRISDEMRDGHALLWMLTELEQRFTEARTVLDGLRPLAAAYPEGGVLLAYSEGLLAAATGDLRAALTDFRSAARIAERLEIHPIAGRSATELARILTLIGRQDEAVTILDQLPPDDDPCAQETRIVNRAWALIDAASRRGVGDDPRATAAVREAADRTGRCPDPHLRALAAVNAAEYALATGDAARAERLIRDLESLPASGGASLSAWRADVVGRWLLERRQPAQARARFEEQAALARAAGLGEEEFRAEIGIGRAWAAAGRPRDAVAHFNKAQAWLERSLIGIPLAEGRGQFMTGHDEAVRHLVDALVDAGSAAEGMRAARLARSAELALAARLDRLSRLSSGERRQWDDAVSRYAKIRRALEEESAEDWKMPRAALEQARADRQLRAENAHEALDAAFRVLVEAHRERPALAAPGRGQVDVAFFPGASRWIVFARTPESTRAVRFSAEELASNARAASILERISRELSQARRVRLFAYGRSEAVDWEVVAWRAAPLISSVEVEYGQDLDLPRTGVGTAAGPVSALVIGDPSGDLAAADAEAASVARALAGWQVLRLAGAAASRDAVLAALPTVRLFHYAGHATGPAAGAAFSALLLGDGARIDLGDLLAMPRVPEVVVLSACEAGADAFTAGGAAGSTVGLAHAFIASGARAVVAPTRAVGDSDARAFVSRLYAALGGRLDTLPAAFRQAAKGGSHSFRLVVQ